MTTSNPPPEFIRFLRSFADNPRPAFPIEVLPPVARTLVKEAAEALPCPPDFVAVPLLVFAGATIGRSRGLRLKESWTETPVLFAAIVGEPGVAKKTPSLKVAQHALGARPERDGWVPAAMGGGIA